MSRKRPAWARIAPVNATAEELKTLVGALTSSDEAQRREAVTNVLAREPVLCWHLADRLVDRLVDGRGAVPRQSAASLVEMGDAVAAVLVLRLYQAQSAEVREELVWILFRIARALPEAGDPCRKMKLLAAVMVALTPPAWYLPRPRRRRRCRTDTTDDSAA